VPEHHQHHQHEHAVHLYIHDGSGAEFKSVLEAPHTLTEKVIAMAGEMDRLTADVAKMRGTVDSALVLIRGFRAALDAAIAAGNPAALNALSDDLESKESELAQAVAANPLPGQTPPLPG